MPNFLMPDIPGAVQRGREFKQRNALNDLALTEARNSVERDQSLRNTLGQLPNVKPGERRNYLSNLASQGPEGMSAASQIQSMWASMSAEDQQRELQKAEDVAATLKLALDDPNAYQSARQQIAQFAPKVADQLPPEFDPNEVQGYINRVLSVKDVFGGGSQMPTAIQDRNDLVSRLPPKDKPREQWTRAEEQAMIEARIAPGAVGSAIQTINDRGNASDIADTEQTIAEGKKFGELTGASRAKAIDTADEEIRKLETNIANLDEAYQALADGAQSGPVVSRWTPTLREETQRLEQARGKLGLDVVGAVTFGALSEAELDMALAVALPNLPPNELMKWIKDRQTAQKKLISYFDEQIQHLDGGGTVASFRRMKRNSDSAGGGNKSSGNNTAKPKQITSDADYNALPSGAEFIDPNGQLRRKP